MLAAFFCASAHAATVKKADDTTVTGPLVALENGAVVLNVDAAGKPQRTPIALEDVVEITIDATKDIPAPPPNPGTPPQPPKPPDPSTPAPAPTPPPAPDKVADAANIPATFDGKTLKGRAGEHDRKS